MRGTAAGLARTGRVLCSCGAAFGAFVLAGWFLGSEIATTFIAGRPAMMPNTALSLLMIGIGAALSPLAANDGRLWKILTSILALGVLTIGGVTIVEYAFRWNLGIDQFLMPVASAATFPGRPSPLTAISLTLLALALLISDRSAMRSTRPVEWLTLGAAFLAFVSLIGHLFGAGQIYEMRTARAIGVALPTAIALLLIACGMLLCNPRAGMMKLATSRGPGGILVRRLGILAIVGPPLLGVLAYRAILLSGYVDLPLTLAALTTAGVPVAVILILVTARRVALVHDALEASREQARTLIEESADGFFVADLDGRYTDVNAAGCHMLGRAREDIIGRTTLDFLPRDEAVRLTEARSRLIDKGPQTAEWHLKKGDGTYLPVEVSAKILADGRWQGIVRDITRRKAAEEAARRSEARLEGIISIAADAIISLDDQQRIVMYNEGAKRIFGWSKAEVLGKPVDVLIPSRFADTHRAHVQAFDREDVVARMMHGRPDIVGVRKNGVEFPAEAAISKLGIDGQRLFTVFLRDVTATRQLQQELREALERFRFLAEAGEILGSSLETEEVTRQLAALAVRSLAACAIIELSEVDGELITVRADAPHGPGTALLHVERSVPDRGRPPEWPVPPRKEPMLVRHVDETWLQSQPSDDPTVALIRKEGAGSLIDVPIAAGDRLIGAMLLFAGAGRSYGQADLQLALDLARRAGLAAENGRLYRAAQAATRAKDDMLRIVAHDLRSPLSAAQVGAALLVRQIPEDRREASQRTADTMQRSIRAATRLVEDLLDVARIESGQLALHVKEVSPEELVHHAVEAYLQLAAGASVRLEADVPPGLPLVFADEDRIQQVFSNLIDNAIKFTPAGGVVRVVARREGGEIRIAVIDTGSGISADHLPRVFDRFWQARGGDRRGAGLGLAIAKGIVDAHGGHIRAESVPREGSTFSFTLPCSAPGSSLRAVDQLSAADQRTIAAP